MNNFQILNEFLAQAYDQPWGPEGSPPPRMWIVDDLTNDPNSPSTPPLNSMIEPVKEICHGMPEQIVAMVRNLFPKKPSTDKLSKLHWHYFIIPR